MSEVSARIDNLLSENNLRRIDLCKATGIPESSIRAWSNRNSMPNAEYAIKVAKFFGVSVEWLITGENEDKEIKLFLSDEEKELIHIFRAMKPEQKDFLINNARFLITQNEKIKPELESKKA